MGDHSPRSQSSNNSNTAVKTFKYLKVTTLHDNKAFYFSTIKQAFMNQALFNLPPDFFENYRLISEVQLSQLKNGKSYVAKKKKSVGEYIQVEVVELSPAEFQTLKSV